MQNSLQHKPNKHVVNILKDGESSDRPVADCDDYTVELKIDLDPDIGDSNTIQGCYKICRLCARLVYEFKLVSIFPVDSSQENFSDKINRFIPHKVSIIRDLI